MRKVVEMAHGGMTSHRSEVITGQLKASILKGIQQGIKTAKAYEKVTQHDGVEITISWWSLHSSNCTWVPELISVGTCLPERLKKILGGTVEESIIPLEHMYFLSIDEFDYLVQALKANEMAFGTFLRQVSSEDRNPQTKCLWLRSIY